jgi:hypothetical protein
MLIKMPEEIKPVFRLYQSSYTDNEIDKVFGGKHLCIHCPYMMIFTGKMFEGAKAIHRGYCMFNHFSLRDLPAILGLSIEETWKQAEMVINNAPSATDIIKIHPKNKNRYIVCCITTKELNNCQIDLHTQGKATLSEEVINNIKEWQNKYMKLQK